MNALLKNYCLALGLFLLASASFAVTSTKVTVNGMVCAFCAQGIEKKLSKLPATKTVFVDLKQKIVAVEAKEGMRLDDQTIKAEIIDAGYDVVKLESVEKSVAQIRDETASKAGK